MKKELKNIENISLLYVEDQEASRNELVHFFKNRVKKLYVAKDGEEGFKKYKEYEPDLVLTDIQMPKINGISMSKMIKDFNENAKIILLTAFNDSEYLFEAIKIGIDGYEIKPIDIKNLLKCMSKVAKTINLEKENKEIFNSLKQHKDVVDERSIVSKTNKNGIITYVNKPFEKISGYSREELIGHKHSLVRHEDTNNKVFEEMWDTILDKKVWTGVLKDKNKNGDYYIVDTIIKPILNTNNEIEEFIALRTDITDLERSKEYFKKQSNTAKINLKDSIRKSLEYKSAIERSNIIMRIGTDRRIKEVNDAFCDISGYSKEELIGQEYSFLKDYRVPNDIYQKKLDYLQEYLNGGNVWKGKTSNTGKNGELFHSNLTIFPLRDKNGNIYEYLGIRHDITELENLHIELEATQREIIYKLGEIGETRSKETGNHVKRVAEYSKLLARKINLDEKEVQILFTASPMHDIGKVGIPDDILHKPGKLNPQEWEIMKSHSEIGYNILKDSKRATLKAAAIVSYTHHEKWNGTGYPNGLKGEEIHVFGRITALADVFDALGSNRCYKKAWPLDKTLEFLENQKAKHFEPRLVEVFIENLEEFLEIRDKYED